MCERKRKAQDWGGVGRWHCQSRMHTWQSLCPPLGEPSDRALRWVEIPRKEYWALHLHLCHKDILLTEKWCGYQHEANCIGDSGEMNVTLCGHDLAMLFGILKVCGLGTCLCVGSFTVMPGITLWYEPSSIYVLEKTAYHVVPCPFEGFGFWLLICFHFHFEALEKNQQWLVYDQQREVYVKGLLAKIFELEQKVETAPQTLPQQTKKTESEGTGIKMFFWVGLSDVFSKREMHQI